MAFAERLLPTRKESGFSLRGYHVWCASPYVDEGGRIYLYASCWREESVFPDGYMENSEIVLATASDPLSPFELVSPLLGKRDTAYFDGMMTHNPFLLPHNGKFYLFYIGCPDGKWDSRAIGVAVAEHPTGPWKRPDKPLSLIPNANNPTAVVTEDGKIRLYFRDGQLRVYVAEAKRPEGPYRILAENIFPKGRIEDMFVYRKNGLYYMLAEDNGGAYTQIERAGVLFTSRDGIRFTPTSPPLAYDFSVAYTDGTRETFLRRERPVLFSHKGKDYLLNGVQPNTGTTRSIIVPLEDSYDTFQESKMDMARR